MFLFKPVKCLPNAFHVFVDDLNPKSRIGIVNHRSIRINGCIDRVRWFAHNVHYADVPGEFLSRSDAAEAIPQGPIHQPISALSF